LNFAKDKVATLIALLLLLSLPASLVLLPSANAAVNVIYHNSYVYVNASPRLVGVDQSVLLVCWSADIPPDVGETAGLVTSPTGRAGWDGYQINVTKPDNSSVLLDLPHSDPVGSDYIEYVPEQAGTYYIQSIFPATWKNSTDPTAPGEAGYPNLYSQYYTAAVSPIASFTVQEEPIQPWVETPLPAGYWTRPINSANREWYVLAGNWLAGGSGGGGASFATPFLVPQGTYGGVSQQLVTCYGPTSAHILWTKPYYTGGIMDEHYEDTGYETAHYQGLSWTGVIILQGKIYYTPRTTAHEASGYTVVDLYAGQTLYETNNTKPAFGQIYNYESPNQHGGFAYLWRTSGVTLPPGITSISSGGGGGFFRPPPSPTWEMLDGYTGNSICKICNVSSAGTQVYGKDGSITYYNLEFHGTSSAPDYHLTIWNSSAIPSELLGDSGTNAWQWRPGTGGRGLQVDGEYFHDGSKGYSLNVSIPSPYGQRNSLLNETGNILCIRESDYMVIGTSGRNDERGNVKGMLMAVSLKPDDTLGTQLWKTTFDEPYAPTSANASNTLAYVLPESNVFVCGNTGMQGGSKTLVWYGYDLTTGEQIWQTDLMPQFQYYVGRWDTYNGLLLQQGYGGVLLAYNATTGKLAWNYTAQGVGFESPYGNYPIGISCMADENGLIYTTGSEHSPTQPLWRGPNLRCINATDGTEVWSILFWGAGMSPTDPSNVAMADGILVGLNFYDNELYAFGKGPSATTVSAPELVPTLGSKVMITGTVTDRTDSGKRNTNDIFDFTLKGTPAISDEDMTAWMEYLFMQQPKPTDAKGVEVVLETLDPNGNFYEIGNVTSDIDGNYRLMWEPPVPGEYKIFASFAGSEAYGPSQAITYMGVAEAPQATPTPTPPPEPPTGMYILGSTIGIIIAIAVVGLVLALMLKRR
jgi:hypothetical protein